MKLTLKDLLIILTLPVALGMGVSACQPEEKISYNEQIRPIFNKNCLLCHGGIRQLEGFSLLFPEDAFSPTESGKLAIVPGDHKKSELYKRLVHPDPEERMPQEGHALSEEEINLIAQWIDQGAEWEDHWAYVPPTEEEIPDVNSDWVLNEIDNFILDRLEEEVLQPAEEASSATLARRVSLDLTGLPPDADELENFVQNPTEDAYQVLIDQLLASPHFGERWAAMWLDLARYADSDGYEKDNHRNIWRYRDWVINAFNRDMPFDQFTIEQLAGDLLPNPSRDQLIATAFHRNSMTNKEGGTLDEEFRVASVIDRVNTTFEVWQSASIGCVQCHSHPYDPIRHKEFYQVFAYLNNTQDADLALDKPNLPNWKEEDAVRIRELIGYISELDPKAQIAEDAMLEEQIRQALFPRLIPESCDDFQDIILLADGRASNNVLNLSAGLDEPLYLKFSNINLDGLTHITYDFLSKGEAGRIAVRLDNKDGKVIQQVDFPVTAQRTKVLIRGDAADGWTETYKREKYDFKPQSGIHDLVFELINTTAKAPDGVVDLREIELHYNGREMLPELQEYKDELTELRAKADLTPIMKKKTNGFERKTNVFDRGNWMVHGEEVQPAIPQSWGGEEIEPNRLAFATWLVSPENPLTARVIVNRIWEQIFGTGIILTTEDFGTQGEPPTHPELLDHLARRLMDSHQWSLKDLLREIVSSAAYRQSSKLTAEKLEKDPYNRLLSRGPRFRLSSEQIRDQALAVSGLLNRTIGGESVMPHQPEGVWQVVYNEQKWETKPDQGHRRGIYTYWKRTTPYPSMVTFDSPSREFCVSRRIRTNTPLQALVMLNDPVYLEAAYALAERMEQAGEDVQSGIKAGYYWAMSHNPDDLTLKSLEDLYERASYEIEADKMKFTPASLKYGSDDHSDNYPMTVVANAILNLDGFLMKE